VRAFAAIEQGWRQHALQQYGPDGAIGRDVGMGVGAKDAASITDRLSGRQTGAGARTMTTMAAARI